MNSRYLLVEAAPEREKKRIRLLSMGDRLEEEFTPDEPKIGKYIAQESCAATTLGQRKVDVPQPSYQLEKLVKACVSGRKDIILDAEDRAIFDGPQEELFGSGADKSSSTTTNASRDARPCAGRVWKPDDIWILRNAKELLLPPTESSLTASSALRKEFRATMLEQNTALDKNDLATLGWYLPPQHNEDNLYQWLVELHSFDPELPIAKDTKSK